MTVVEFVANTFLITLALTGTVMCLGIIAVIVAMVIDFWENK